MSLIKGHRLCIRPFFLELIFIVNSDDPTTNMISFISSNPRVFFTFSERMTTYKSCPRETHNAKVERRDRFCNHVMHVMDMMSMVEKEIMQIGCFRAGAVAKLLNNANSDGCKHNTIVVAAEQIS